MNNYELVEKALKYIAQNFKNQPSLEEIAKHVGVSEFHFQKLFTTWAGISPKRFLTYVNVNYAKSLLLSGEDITNATYKSGLSSTSRLHDHFINIIAMTPSEYKNGGQSLKIIYSFNKSNFGDYLIASTHKGICEILFGNNKDTLKHLKIKWPNALILKGSNINHNLVNKFINNDLKVDQKINTHIKGTNFQIKVWEALLKIPEGNLSTYAEISRKINSKAYRAVGTAIGNNHIAYLIPCHRVIKSTGVFGNYRWGEEKKLAMLGFELSKKSNTNTPDNHNRSIK